MHPAVIAVLVVDLLGAVAISLAMLQAIRIAVGWNASSASALQLRLERRAEEGAAAGRLGAVLHLLSALGMLLLINHVLPALVPGAMCGVGVMQALPDGWTAVAMRMLSLVALCAWYAVDRLNRRAPTGPLTPQGSRLMLVAGAAALIASWRSFTSLAELDLHRAVSCCAAVYDLGARSSGSGAAFIAGTPHARLLCGLAVVLIAPAFIKNKARTVLPYLGMAVVAGAFVVLGAWVIVDFSAPVVYGTLGHRCPLCLFLPEHGGFGYVAFGALAWVAFEAASVAAVVMVARRAAPQLRDLAWRRARVGWLRAGIAAAIVLAAALGPQLVWRLRFGVSIGG